MTVQDRHYILVRGYALDAALQKTSQDDEVAFYSSIGEVDTILAASGSTGVQYTVRTFKEVVE